MGNNMKKQVGLITFHNSYNCGSMLQAYALQTCIEKCGAECKIIDFSNEGQHELYSVMQKNDSLKNILKNIILLPRKKRIIRNCTAYESFKNTWFHLSAESYTESCQLTDDKYDVVVTGSDQVWNITIEDSDDAYFLPWVKHAKKVAYAPSFGSKNLQKYATDLNKYINYLKTFSALSIREYNGKKWLMEIVKRDVPVLLDPTLLLSAEDYKKMISTSLVLPKDYIFYYAPSYLKEINTFVKRLSNKYNLPVIAFNTKTFFVKGMQYYGFSLPELESPATYLQLICKATIVITTSFHGTVFSTIFKKRFWTMKNTGMFGDDDRVKTMIEQLGLEKRLIEPVFDEKMDYMEKPDYEASNKNIVLLQEKAKTFLCESLNG